MNLPYHDDQLLTRKEAAKYLNYAPNTLAVWACTNRYDLKLIKIGRSVNWPETEPDKTSNV